MFVTDKLLCHSNDSLAYLAAASVMKKKVLKNIFLSQTSYLAGIIIDNVTQKRMANLKKNLSATNALAYLAAASVTKKLF